MRPLPKFQGFTLVELAVVIVIVGLLLGGLLMPFSMQMEQRQYVETRKTLEEAQEALFGFAMANGRLPCPAEPNNASLGRESFCTAAAPAACGAVLYAYQTHGRCSNPYNGFLPAATLGITPVNSNGFALDSFGGVPANRIRYAISDNAIGAVNNPFTTTNGLKSAGLSNVGIAITNGNMIYICDKAPTGALPYTTCTGGTILSNTAAFVVYSAGKNSSSPTSGVGADEIVNPNPNSPDATNDDLFFVSHTPAPVGAANGEFDDIVQWGSSSILVNKLVTAGQLP